MQQGEKEPDRSISQFTHEMPESQKDGFARESMQKAWQIEKFLDRIAVNKLDLGRDRFTLTYGSGENQGVIFVSPSLERTWTAIMARQLLYTDYIEEEDRRESDSGPDGYISFEH